MYRQILVATGGSVWSDAAVACATDLGARMNAALRIVTVLNAPTTSARPEAGWRLDQLIADIQHTGQVIATQAAAQAASAGVTYEVSCPWGHVPETILQAAAECDLIVLGSRGPARGKRLREGYITHTVVAKALQPVAIVKPADAPHMALGRRLLVAIGRSPWSNAAFEYALQLAQSLDLELCVLHVQQGWLPRGMDRVIAEGKHLLTLAEARAAIAGVAYESILATEPIEEAILQTADRKKCDTIILGARGMRGWKRLRLGNIVNTVAVKAPQPVLIVKHFCDSERPRRRSI